MSTFFALQFLAVHRRSVRVEILLFFKCLIVFYIFCNISQNMAYKAIISIFITLILLLQNLYRCWSVYIIYTHIYKDICLHIDIYVYYILYMFRVLYNRHNVFFLYYIKYWICFFFVAEPNPKALSANTQSLKLTWKGWKDKNLFRYKCFNLGSCIACIAWL